MTLNRTKTKIYLPPHLCTPANLALCADHGLTVGCLQTSQGPAYGIKIAGIPFGDPHYQLQFLHNKFQKICTEAKTILWALDPLNSPHPSIPSLQTLWVILTRSLQHRGSYWTRHLPPALTAQFTTNMDCLLLYAAKKATNINFPSQSSLCNLRLRLPPSLLGAGLRQQYTRRYIDYIGGLCNGIPPLLDRQDEYGNTYAGRLPTPSLVALFGLDSFDSNCTTPWAHLLSSHPSSPFAKALQECHTYISTTFASVAIDQAYSPTHISNVPIESLGCNMAGSLLPSPTRVITKELELPQHDQHMITQRSKAGSPNTPHLDKEPPCLPCIS